MTTHEAKTIVIDVATKRKPHSRTVLLAAVSMLEAKPAESKKVKK